MGNLCGGTPRVQPGAIKKKTTFADFKKLRYVKHMDQLYQVKD